MSSSYDERLSLDDQQLDRLVDGSLEEHDRRDFLIRLENEPDGWRRCALAFLEAQAWAISLKRICRLRQILERRLMLMLPDRPHGSRSSGPLACSRSSSAAGLLARAVMGAIRRTPALRFNPQLPSL
jgi:hypothetical protein